MTKAQQWESNWWSTCQNTFGEELKQLTYARRMGLEFYHNGKSPYNINMNGQSVLDIGGGPVSLLLKCTHLKRGKVIDPLSVPDWVIARYKLSQIEFEQMPAEQMYETEWDECWIYNCLQHVENPIQIIQNVCKVANLIRIFEWVDTPTNIGHPHSLSKEKLDTWLNGCGKVDQINENTAVGKAYYGVFPIHHKEA